MTPDTSPPHHCPDDSMPAVIAVGVASHHDESLHKAITTHTNDSLHKAITTHTDESLHKAITNNTDDSTHTSSAFDVFASTELDVVPHLEAPPAEACLVNVYNNKHFMKAVEKIQDMSSMVDERVEQLKASISAQASELNNGVVTGLTEKYDEFRLEGMKKLNALVAQFDLQQKLDMAKNKFAQETTTAIEFAKQPWLVAQDKYTNFMTWKVKAAIYSAVGVVAVIAGLFLYRYMVHLYNRAAKFLGLKSDIPDHHHHDHEHEHEHEHENDQEPVCDSEAGHLSADPPTDPPTDPL